MDSKRICVLGCGSWGTALANHLRSTGHEVVVWGKEEDVLQSISKNQENPVYFPGVTLEKGIASNTDLDAALKDVEVVVVSVPSVAIREVAAKLASRISKDVMVVCTAKGLEDGTLKCLTDVLEEELPENKNIVALSGPSFAAEVVKKYPTAVTIAARDKDTAKRAAHVFHHGTFRVYTSNDIIGVELGGALKNVIALATGVIDGVGFGLNARAALVTRGLVEMERIILASGGKERTVHGLSGLGDLLLTSTGDLSRNRRVGLRLGKGEKLDDILADIGQVAEGVVTARKAKLLAERLNVDAPITSEVVKIIEGSSSPQQSAETLLGREIKEE